MAYPLEAESTSSQDSDDDAEAAALTRVFKTVSAAIDRPDRRIPSDLTSLVKMKLMPLLQSCVIFSKLVKQ